MTRTSGGLIHGYSGTIWTVAVLWSRDSYTRVYRGISLWIVHLAKRHVAHPPLQIKEPRPQRGSSLRLSTVRDHGGAGQLDPRTVITQYTTLACRHKNKLCVIGPQNVPSVARVAAGAFGFLSTTSQCSPSQPCNHLSNILLRMTWTVWARSLRKTWRQYFLFGSQTNPRLAVVELLRALRT